MNTATHISAAWAALNAANQAQFPTQVIAVAQVHALLAVAAAIQELAEGPRKTASADAPRPA